MFVVLYFMHVRWGSRLTWVVAGSGFFWLLIMFSFTLTDYMSRGWLQGTLRSKHNSPLVSAVPDSRGRKRWELTLSQFVDKIPASIDGISAPPS